MHPAPRTGAAIGGRQRRLDAPHQKAEAQNGFAAGPGATGRPPAPGTWGWSISSARRSSIQNWAMNRMRRSIFVSSLACWITSRSTGTAPSASTNPRVGNSLPHSGRRTSGAHAGFGSTQGALEFQSVLRSSLSHHLDGRPRQNDSPRYQPISRQWMAGCSTANTATNSSARQTRSRQRRFISRCSPQQTARRLVESKPKCEALNPSGRRLFRLGRAAASFHSRCRSPNLHRSRACPAAASR